MIINSEFEIGQKVYYIVYIGGSKYVACEGYITGITLNRHFDLEYKINDFNTLYTKTRLFKTKEEAEEEIKNSY